MGIASRLCCGGSVESVQDYVGVLVPLDQAHLYSQPGKSKGKSEARPEDDEEIDEAKDGDYEMQGMLQGGRAGEYTIEGLRKEMREGRQGQWTTYESESRVFLSCCRVGQTR